MVKFKVCKLSSLDWHKKRKLISASVQNFQLTKCRWFKNEGTCIMFRWNSEQQHKRNKITSILMFVFLLNGNYTFSGHHHEFGWKNEHQPCHHTNLFLKIKTCFYSCKWDKQINKYKVKYTQCESDEYHVQKKNFNDI